ncbi:hypothetical protein IAQ61_005803 [Plenodomus lingam]|uniref:uncharacterized protein n=1 Tax=Leptosphaeria maculans TaxID=5022 RepID=UPI0033269D4B|nr:hypothetical protein IAQ61_005803 [Plenodomus lingam]
MASFDCLPAELHLDIFSYLDLSDLKAVRQATRALGHNSSLALFRSIVACARYQGLSAYENVANHPSYSKCVQEIVFDGSSFVENFAKCADLYFRAQMNFPELDASSPLYGRTRWKRYQMLYQEQQDLKASGVLLQTLKRGLDRMPNVTSVVYSPHARLLSTERKDMRDIVPVGFICYPTAHSRRAYTTPDHAFRYLMEAIFLSNLTSIRRLKVESVLESVWKKEPATEFSSEMFDLPTEAVMQAGRHLFRNLTDIELNMALRDFNFEHMRPAAQRTFVPFESRWSNLAELLATAKDLQHLTLDVTMTQFNDDQCLDIKRLLYHQSKGQTWAKLQTMSLGGLHARQSDWIDLVKDHSGTLKSLTFRRCRMVSGFWVEVVNEVVCNSTISSFVLDLVDEPYLLWAQTDRAQWQYEGHLVMEDGGRNFVDTNPMKKSLYSFRSRLVE